MSVIAEAAQRLGRALGVELALICGSCGESGEYRVGRVLIDEERLLQNPDDPESAVAFTGIFGCCRCRADGPWRIPSKTGGLLLAGLLAESPDVVSGRLKLFDGTLVRTGAEAARHVLSLLEKDPANASLWNRLGNANYAGLSPDHAVRAWEQALAFDPGHLESHFHLGMVAFEAGLGDEALRHLHAVLRLARGKKDAIPLGKLRGILKKTLRTLLDLRDERGDDAGIFPSDETPGADDEATGADVYGFDLSREEEWDRWADLILGIGEVSSLLREERDRRRRRKRRW